MTVLAPVREVEAPALRDEKLAAVPVLLGPEATGVLQAALEGATIRSARVSQVHYRPGRAIRVCYRAQVGTRDRQPQWRLLVAQAGSRLPTGTTIVGDGTDRVAVWSIRTDPWLPGLAVALDRGRMRSMLQQLGISEAISRLRTRSYRPGRRAVVEIRAGRHPLFVKVVRPSRVRRLQQLHTQVAEQLPVPRSLGWSDELGLVVLEGIPGPTLREVLENRATASTPDPADLLFLLDRIPPDLDDAPTVPSPSERAQGHVRLIGTLVPDLEPAAAELAVGASTTDNEKLVPVHGDFHSSQMILAPGGLRGLVDIDSVGIGPRSGDLATLLAHLQVVGLGSPGARAAIRYGARLVRAFDHQVDPATLRRQVAGSLLGFATGPFRTQEAAWPSVTARLIAAAQRWLESAEAV